MKKDEKKKIVGIIIIIIIIIIIFVFLWQFKNQKTKIDKSYQKQDISNGISTEIDLDEITKKIKKEYKQSSFFKECLFMGMGINQCLKSEVQNKIKKTNDVKYCDDLLNSEDTKSCISNYYIDRAINSGDVSLCEKLDSNSSLKQTCQDKVYLTQAVNSLDKSFCQKTSENQKNYCLTRVISEVAKKELDEKKCDEIEDNVGTDKQMCKDEVGFLKEQNKLIEKSESLENTI